MYSPCQTKLRAGHQVASGASTEDTRFPGGTIRMQAPFFAKAGLDIETFFAGDFLWGTLNLSLAPSTFKIKKPEYVFKDIKWTDQLPAENFFLSKAAVEYAGVRYKALLYIPDPSTKPDHFQPPDVIEVIAQKIPDLSYDAKLTLFYNPEAVEVI